MLSQMLHTLRDQSLVARGDRVLVAVSGGPDSTALLHGLLHLAPRLDVAIEAAVVDHRLRPESAGEAAAVVERCAALGVACATLAVDVAAARKRHVSWQEAARTARLAALLHHAAGRGCARIALGHTADDQAETVLFRIVRGTGVAGLAGIPYAREAFIRPLLDVRRAEVLRFLAKRRIAYTSDPSNQDRRYARARIRQEWLPLLAAENPRIVEALLALAADARRCGTGPPPERYLPRRARTALARLQAEGQGTRLVSVRGGEIAVTYGTATFRPPRTGPPAAGPTLEITETASPVPDLPSFDADAVAAPLAVRALRPGDRMRPRGGRGSRKLSDLLIDAKVPRERRRTLPVLVAADGTILYVPGLRPAEAGRPSHTTRRWIQVRALEPR